MRKYRAAPLIFFLLLSVIPVLTTPTASESSGDITFQPNVIPSLNITARPEDKPESFRFEWLGNKFDIELFFNVSWRPERLYSLDDFLNDIVNDWNCSDADITFQTARNDSSVSFGWVLNGVENVSDYIYEAWFKIEDTQPFDYDDIELEEIEILDEEELYNRTRFHLPENLVLSFEDLRHKGFVIGWQNKTSTELVVCVKGFSGKSSWDLDPITFSSPIITVTGGTSGSPLDFEDLYNADKAGTLQLQANTTATNMTLTTQVQPADNKSITLDIVANNVATAGVCNITGFEKGGIAQTESITIAANTTYTTTEYWASVSYLNCTGVWAISVNQSQWGVVWKTGARQFMLDAKIVIGVFTPPFGPFEYGYFADENVEVLFNSGVGAPLIDVVFGDLRFGVLIDSTLKTSENGVQILSENAGIIVKVGQYSVVYIYSSSFSATGSSSIRIEGDADFYSVALDDVYLYVQAPAKTTNFFRVTVTNSTQGFFLVSSPTSVVDVLVTSSSSGVFLQIAGATLRDSVFRNNTHLLSALTITAADSYLINIDSDAWNFDWFAVCTREVYRQYEFDLNVTDNNKNPLQSANVTVKHYGQSEAQDFTVLTGANGSFATKTLTMGFYNQTGGDTIYDYNDYNITVTATGYRTYSKNFTLNDQIDWTIAMLPAVTLSPSYWFPMFVIGIILFAGSVILYLGKKRR